MKETRQQVKFTGVGRNKKTWCDMILLHDDGRLDADEMHMSVKKHARLASNDIYFDDDGTVIVGMFRPVGKWEIVP